MGKNICRGFSLRHDSGFDRVLGDILPQNGVLFCVHLFLATFFVGDLIFRWKMLLNNNCWVLFVFTLCIFRFSMFSLEVK